MAHRRNALGLPVAHSSAPGSPPPLSSLNAGAPPDIGPGGSQVVPDRTKINALNNMNKNFDKWGKRNRGKKFILKATFVPGGPNGTGRLKKERIPNPYYRKPAAAPAPAAASGGEPVTVPDPISESVPEEPAGPGVQAGSVSGSGGLIDLTGVFKPYQSSNPSKLLEPARRLLDRNRQDVEAARAKAATDLQAFYDYLHKSQQATQGGLATSLGGIAQDAAKTREQSMGRVTDAVSKAVAASGGNADLMAQSGAGAQIASDAQQQQGQDAANQKAQAVQAGLNVRAADQSRVDQAFSAGMPLELSRAYNKRQSELSQQDLSLAEKLVALKAQDAASRNEYNSNAAAQRIAASTANAELAGKDADRDLKAQIENSKAKTARAVANVKAATALKVKNGEISAARAKEINKAYEAKANRASREAIALLKSKGAAGSGNASDLDSLASDVQSNMPDTYGMSAPEVAEAQEQAATQFVQRARTLYGNGTPWTGITNILQTYFPQYMARPGAKTALQRYWR